MIIIPKESSIVKQIRKYLDTLDHCHHEKTHGGYYSNNGKPDITGCVRGWRFEIEVKRPGEVPRPLQKAIIKKWEEAGALSGVAYSVEDVKEILKPAFKKGED